MATLKTDPAATVEPQLRSQSEIGSARRGDLYKDTAGRVFQIGRINYDTVAIWFGNCFLDTSVTPVFPMTRLPKGSVVSYTQES